MSQATPNLPSKRAWRTSLIWLGLAAIAWLVLKMLAPVLTPFVVALVLAYSLLPAVERLYSLSKKRLPRIACVLIVELVFLLVTTGILLLIVPILGKEIPLLQAQLPNLAERINTTVQPWLAGLGIQFSLDPASVKSFMRDYFETNGEAVWAKVLPSLKMGGGVLISMLGYAVLVPVVLFYFLADWSRIVSRVQVWIPPARLPAVKSFLTEADSVLGQYMRGQLLVMLVLAVYYCIVLSLWGLDLAIPIGLFTGLAVCIPYLGFGLGLLMAGLACVLQFDLTQAALILVTSYGVGQLLESFVLTPRLVGERIGLHPLAVIFALLAFGEIFGFIGVLVALPVSAVLLVAMRRIKAQYLASDLYRH